MVASRGWLVDKSAHVRLALSPDAASWAERIAHGLVRISPVTVLELGFSARNAADWHSQRWGVPITRMPLQGLDPGSEERAIEVQGLLAERGHHRAPGPPDLLVAATAERAGLTLLHVDHDFDLIADITGQPVERLTGDF